MSDKKNLFLNMRNYYRSIGKDPFEVLPVTFVVEDGLNDPEFDRFEEFFKGVEKKQPE